jgi:hypothetical protein
MDTIDLLFASNDEVIVDALVSKIREQGEDLADLQDTVDKLARSVREVEAINEKLGADLAAAKKAAKGHKKVDRPFVSKIAPKDMDPKTAKVVKATGGKAYAAPVPVKRKVGRPKKVVK